MRGIRGHIWFDNSAEEAVATYTDLFEDSDIGDRLYYTEAGQEIHGQEPGSTLTIDFSIAGRKLVALNGGPSVQVNEYPWAERYGWLQDRFGVSWQAAPIALQEMLRDGDPEQVRRVTNCFMQMKKIDLDVLMLAFEGDSGR